MTLTVLTHNDLPKILQLFESDFPDGWDEKMLLSAMKMEGGRFLIMGIFDCELLVGVTCLSAGLDVADIDGVVVKKEYRRRGLAKEMLLYAQKFIKEQFNLNKIMLEVRALNQPAIELYKKMGFKGISFRRKYYPDGEDALVMVKEI